MAQPQSQLQDETQEPTAVQLDSKCLHSALKEFFSPLRTNDSRADFYAVYRRESEEFDKDYAGKYDEDLNTSLIFAGLFSAVGSAFIIDIQSNLQPDPNEVMAAYMQILIHATNNSLFPNAPPSPVAWSGPPADLVIIQSLLYASFAMSLLAAFLAMLGKQWVDRYIRNRGGSAADKSRDRQRKLDGLERWHFHTAIEILPVMLQLALMLFGCAMSFYLWTICRTVAGVVLGFTLLGVISYLAFTLAATLHYDCPYQTPPSTLIRALNKYLSHSDSAFARSLRHQVASLAGAASRLVKKPAQIFRRLRFGVRIALRNSTRSLGVPEESEDIPLTFVESHSWPFKEISIDWEVCKADARCISWMLDSTTESDVIFSIVRFAADMTWYPDIASFLSPLTLSDLFHECLSEGRVIPDKLEQASMTGIALASILSVQLCMEPERDDLRRLSGTIYYHVTRISKYQSKLSPGIGILRIVTETPGGALARSFRKWWILSNTPGDLPTTHKLCLSRTILQTVWRWRRIQDSATTFNLGPIDLFCDRLMENGDHIVPALKVNCFLIMAISLGLEITGVRDLDVPNTEGSLGIATLIFSQQLSASIASGESDPCVLNVILSSLNHLAPFRAINSARFGFEWLTAILDSKYPECDRYTLAHKVVQLLGTEFDTHPPTYFYGDWVNPLLGFLSLSEKFNVGGSETPPGCTALRILLRCRADDVGAILLPILVPMLSYDHPLRSRNLALEVFHRYMPSWFSQQMETISSKNLDKLLQAVGDPFASPNPPSQDTLSVGPTACNPMMVVTVLIEFASSDLWKNHLSPSNFSSYEELVSTKQGRNVALNSMLQMASHAWTEFLRAPSKITAAIRRLVELRCPNTAEVVVLWAWTVGVVNAADRSGWRMIGRATLDFYGTHRIGHPKALEQHIIDVDKATEQTHLGFLLENAGDGCSPCRVKNLRSRVAITGDVERYPIDLQVSRACQLRRLYQLIGHDPTAREEVIPVEGVGGELDATPGLLMTMPVPSVDFGMVGHLHR